MNLDWVQISTITPKLLCRLVFKLGRLFLVSSLERDVLTMTCFHLKHNVNQNNISIDLLLSLSNVIEN